MVAILLGEPALGAAMTDALLGEAQAALDKGDAAQAMRLADTALAEEVTPLQRGRLLLSRGLAQQLQGAREAAMVDFTAALQTHALPPDERAQALLQRGFLLDSMDRLNDAAKDYGAVIALKSVSIPTALNNRANIYRRQNRLAEARRDYLAALGAGSLRPQFPYFGLGQIAEAQNDMAAARDYYAKAVAADPAYGLALARLNALGGPPDGQRTDPGVIVLRPPGSKAAPVALQPPAAGEAERIVLRRPAPRKAVAKPSGSSSGPVLKGALDAPASRARGGTAEVQLGAWRSAQEAQAGWRKARAQAAGLLDGAQPHVVEADLPGKGHYFRLRTGVPAGSSQGDFCAALGDQGLACLPVRD